jgi:hypothetical protein
VPLNSAANVIVRRKATNWAVAALISSTVVAANFVFLFVFILFPVSFCLLCCCFQRGLEQPGPLLP